MTIYIFHKKCILFSIAFFQILILFLFFSSSAYAGGGRIEIENFNGVGLTGQNGTYVQARIYDESQTNTVAGEKAEFQVKNPRNGDRCVTANIIANEYGQIFGQCFADQPGTITIYVHSLDKGDDSSEYLLTFLAPQSTVAPTSTPKQEAAIQPTIQFPEASIIKETQLLYEVQPSGPLNPGTTYLIKVVVNLNEDTPCRQCVVEIDFQGNSQPLDSIQPAKAVTNDQGITYINITSYMPFDREVVIMVQSQSGEQYNPETVALSYNRNPFLSAVRMINRVLDLGIPFPPMGNVYPAIVNQHYKDGYTRIVNIKYNAPFGTKIFKIYQEDMNGKMQLLRLTKDKQTSVEVDAFNKVNLGIKACSTSKGDDISCVGPNTLSIPKITESIEVSNPEDQVKNEEEIVNNSPFNKFFKWIYSLYK